MAEHGTYATASPAAGDKLFGVDVSDLTQDAAGSSKNFTVSGVASYTVSTMAQAEATIKGRAVGAGTGDPADLTAAQVRTILGTGALALLNSVGSGQIDDGAVALADMANLAADAIIGRANGGGTGVPQALTATQVRTIIGQALHNFAASATPATTDDSGDGYSVGSLWVNTGTTPRLIYVCLDATASAAQWFLLNELATGETYDPTDPTEAYLVSSGTIPTGDKYLRTVTAGGSTEDGISEDGVEIGVITFHLFNGGDVLTTSITDEAIAEFSGSAVAMRAILDTTDDSTSSITISVRKCTVAQWDQGASHPVGGDEISSTEDFVISGAHQGVKTTGLSSWTSSGAVTRGDVLQFVINSCDADIRSVKGQLELRKS